MRPVKDITGARFGRLTVIGEYKSGTSSLKTYPSVLCRCDCGTERRFDVGNLRAGATTSCGCFRLENSSKMGQTFGRVGGLKQREYPPVESSARDLYQKYMKRHAGNLTFEEFWILTQQSCYYCNTEPQQVYLNKNATDNESGRFIYNGLDRLDISKGYDSDNVKPCCGTCNFMRHKLSVEGFYKQIVKIVKHRKEDLTKLGLPH
jgi:hypothetical protein